MANFGVDFWGQSRLQKGTKNGTTFGTPLRVQELNESGRKAIGIGNILSKSKGGIKRPRVQGRPKYAKIAFPGSSWLLPRRLLLAATPASSWTPPSLLLGIRRRPRVEPSWIILSLLVRPPPGVLLRSQEEPGRARKNQEEPGGARRSQEDPGGARKTQEEPGGARRSQEEPGGARRSHQRARESQEEPGETLEEPGGARRSQEEAPGRLLAVIAEARSQMTARTSRFSGARRRLRRSQEEPGNIHLQPGPELQLDSL